MLSYSICFSIFYKGQSYYKIVSVVKNLHFFVPLQSVALRQVGQSDAVALLFRDLGLDGVADHEMVVVVGGNVYRQRLSRGDDVVFDGVLYQALDG